MNAFQKTKKIMRGKNAVISTSLSISLSSHSGCRGASRFRFFFTDGQKKKLANDAKELAGGGANRKHYLCTFPPTIFFSNGRFPFRRLVSLFVY